MTSIQKNDRNKKPVSKKAYQTPKVTVYGGIAKLTAAKAAGSVKDGTGNKKS